MKEAVVFTCHNWNEHVRQEFSRMQSQVQLKRECYLLCQSDTPVKYPVFQVTSDDLYALGFPNLSVPLKSGFKQLPAFVFHRACAYERYWFIEYDVRFTGDWEGFFTAFDDSPADLLAAHFRTQVQEPDWCWWSSLRHPSTAVNNKLRCFAPIFRMTYTAMSYLYDECRDGWEGHPEVLWPTLLYRMGHRLEDFGADSMFTPPERRHQWYLDSTFNPRGQLLDGTLRFRNPMSCPGALPDTLYHPVK